MLRRTVAAAGLAAALATSALAADKGKPVDQPDRDLGPSASTSFACYLEGSAGKNITSTRVGDDFAGPVTIAADGLQAGLGAGCDVRVMHESGLGVVVGILGRYDFLDVKTRLGDSSISAEDMWTVAARAGLKLNPGVLGYGLIGRSGASLSYPDIKSDPQGWMYGVGLEFKLANSPVHLFAEWNHVTFDRQTIDGATLRPDADVIRGGVRYFFGSK